LNDVFDPWDRLGSKNIANKPAKNFNDNKLVIPRAYSLQFCIRQFLC